MGQQAHQTHPVEGDEIKSAHPFQRYTLKCLKFPIRFEVPVENGEVVCYVVPIR